ncbi:Wzz/FepE/Etk N-terminal domain-containing protein [Dehalobacter sp.]|uniref:YveK family protein n=1 Tax=Dehalobacter sp. TaxID=1962289 RepID=UPI002582BACD|nr:Wzz/FepE/Etk N-terminal domain-containing protein [Dehalobacter sp.]MDJ0304957.1 Wzz/FepE/Etk N-terminal domain-containing protein [Dehalobacter sp.]
MEIRRIVYSVVRKWWLIILLVILSGGTGYYFNVISTQTAYSADTTLYVLNRDKVEAGQALSSQDLTMSQTLLTQFSGIFYSRSVTTAAADELKAYNISPNMLGSMVSISSEKDSNLLTIRAMAPTPELAAAAANAMANEFISQIRTITKSDFIGILDAAQVPAHPIPNNGLMETFLWMLIGLIISLGIIFVIEYFDTTVRSAEDIETCLKIRVIGIIPEHDIR